MINPLNLRQLELFVLVADHKSISKAAAEAYLSVPSLIKQLNALEDSLEFKLFTRSNHGVSLTAAGAAFYIDAQSILDHLHTAVARGKSIAQSMTAPLTIGVINVDKQLLHICQQYAERNPDLAPIECVSMRMYDLERALMQKKIDLYWGADYTPANDELGYQTLYRSKPMIIMNRRHPLARKACIEWSDLSGIKLITFPKGLTKFGDRLNAHLSKAYPDIHLTVPSGNISDMLDVRLNKAVATAFEMEYIESDDLCMRPVSEQAWKSVIDVNAVFRTPITPSVQSFIDTMIDVFRDNQSERFD